MIQAVEGAKTPVDATLTISRTAQRVTSSAIRDILSVAERKDVISLAGGLPTAESFPSEQIAQAYAHFLATEPGPSLQYSATEGYEPLRRWVGNYRQAAWQQVIITHGSQQALELTIRALLDEGDAVVLADPAYVGAIQAFQLNGATLHGVPSDEDGMAVDVLHERLRKGLRPKCVYVVPNFHNPTGSTLSLERRKALGELAEQYGFIVIEDDPYGELRWDGSPLASIREFSDQVVTLGSFSKVLCPGLRIGYSVSPPHIAGAVTIVKQATDLHTSTLSQRVVHRVVDEPGFLPAQLDRARAIYEARAKTLASAISEQMEGELHTSPVQGGMFLWSTLSSELDTHRLLPHAVECGVAYVPGLAFGVSDTYANSLRLSFATVPMADLHEGIRRLKVAIRSAPA